MAQVGLRSFSRNRILRFYPNIAVVTFIAAVLQECQAASGIVFAPILFPGQTFSDRRKG